jgi:hypothetical protein
MLMQLSKYNKHLRLMVRKKRIGSRKTSITKVRMLVVVTYQKSKKNVNRGSPISVN